MLNDVPKSKLIAFATGGCLFACAVGWMVFTIPPSHKGKSVDYWFRAQYSESADERRIAEEAFQSMGNRSLDFLLSQVTAKKPTLTQRFCSWVETKLLRRGSVGVECGLSKTSEAANRQALLGKAFSTVGERAEPIAKKLGALIADPLCAYEAAISLVSIGPAAWPEVEQALCSRDVAIRRVVASALGRAVNDKTNACMLALKGLKDPDSLVRNYAAHSVGELEVCPNQAVPALISALGDSDARVRYISLFAIEKFGAEATIALVDIRKLQADSEENVRKSATEIVLNLERFSHTSP